MASLRLFLLALLCAAAASAATLSGRVLDPSGAAVAGATVSAASRTGSWRAAAVTDAAGAFHFASAPAGEVLLTASAPGFAPSLPVTLAAPASADLRLELQRVVTNIVVTATGTPQPVDEIAKALDVVSAAQLDLRGEFSLPEALKQIPGLRVAQFGGPGALTSVAVRGLRTFDTALLVDGFRLRDAAAPQGEATGFLSDILFAGADRIEILRGSGSSLYGTHATGGVLNLISDAGGGPLRGSLTAEGGGLGLLRSQAKITGSAAQDRLRYSFALAHLNVLSGVDGDDRHRNSTLQSHLQFLAAPRTSFRARFWLADTFLGLNTSPFANPALPAVDPVPAIPLAPDAVRRAGAGLPFAWGAATFAPSLNDPDARRSARLWNGLGGLSHQLGDAVTLRVDYQGLATARDNRDGPLGVRFQPSRPNANLFDGRIDVVSARADARFGAAHLVSGGYEFERERFTSFSRSAVVDARAAVVQRSSSLFLQDQARLFSGRLALSLSGRWQTFAVAAPRFAGGTPAYRNVAAPAPPDALTGDASAAWFFRRSGTKLRAHAGNAYRAPSLYERFGAGFFGGSFTPYGDPRLRPDRTLGLDFGIDQYLASSRARLSASYFYTRLQEVIVFDFSGRISPATDPFGRFGGYRNTRGGIARGVELSAEIRPSRSLTVNSSYTYTNARERNSVLLGGSLRTLRVFPHQFTLLATQRIGSRIDATFDFLAASRYTAPFFAGSGSRAFLFPGPRKADLMLSYTLPAGERHRVQFYSRLENLGNQRYFEDGFRTPRFWGVGGVRWLF
jgi:iron complex outermembrane receptor protein